MPFDDGGDAALRALRDVARHEGDRALVLLVAGALGDLDPVLALRLALGAEARHGWIPDGRTRSYGWAVCRAGRVRYLGRTAADACRQLCRDALTERAIVRRAQG